MVFINHSQSELSWIYLYSTAQFSFFCCVGVLIYHEDVVVFTAQASENPHATLAPIPSSALLIRCFWGGPGLVLTVRMKWVNWTKISVTPKEYLVPQGRVGPWRVLLNLSKARRGRVCVVRAGIPDGKRMKASPALGIRVALERNSILSLVLPSPVLQVLGRVLILT